MLVSILQLAKPGYLIILVLAVPAWADQETDRTLHKCVTIDGHTRYQAEPCASGETEQVIGAVINDYEGTDTVSAKRPLAAKASPNFSATRKPYDNRRERCQKAEKVLERLARNRYNNEAGGMAEKLRARSGAIREKIAYCH